jgi:hypothetical protein
MPGVQILRDQAYAVLLRWQKVLQSQGIYSFQN